MNEQKCHAIVSGGSSGLGLATTKLILSQGGKVVLLDIKKPDYDEFTIKEKENLYYFQLDITKENEIKNCLAYSIDEINNINLLVNCAGIGVPCKVIGKEGVHPENIFNKIIQINLIGSFNLLKLTAEKMINNKPDNDGFRGAIINTASIAAFDGQIGQAAYSASKGGLVSLTLPIARELARYGIRVCTVAPGLFETPMLEGLPEEAYKSLVEKTVFPKRFGKPEEYAHLIMSIFKNNMINGEVIRLDGSLRMAPK